MNTTELIITIDKNGKVVAHYDKNKSLPLELLYELQIGGGNEKTQHD